MPQVIARHHNASQLVLFQAEPSWNKFHVLNLYVPRTQVIGQGQFEASKTVKWTSLKLHVSQIMASVSIPSRIVANYVYHGLI